MSNNATIVFLAAILALGSYGCARELVKKDLIESQIEYQYVTSGYVKDKDGRWGKAK